MRREYEALSKLVGKNFAVLEDGMGVYLTPKGEVRDIDGRLLLPELEGRARLFERNLAGGGGTSDAVQYIPQELTESQQMQARKNLGVYYTEDENVCLITEQSAQPEYVDRFNAYWAECLVEQNALNRLFMQEKVPEYVYAAIDGELKTLKIISEMAEDGELAYGNGSIVNPDLPDTGDQLLLFPRSEELFIKGNVSGAFLFSAYVALPSYHKIPLGFIPEGVYRKRIELAIGATKYSEVMNDAADGYIVYNYSGYFGLGSYGAAGKEVKVFVKAFESSGMLVEFELTFDSTDDNAVATSITQREIGIPYPQNEDNGKVVAFVDGVYKLVSLSELQ